MTVVCEPICIIFQRTDVSVIEASVHCKEMGKPKTQLSLSLVEARGDLPSKKSLVKTAHVARRGHFVILAVAVVASELSRILNPRGSSKAAVSCI